MAKARANKEIEDLLRECNLSSEAEDCNSDSSSGPDPNLSPRSNHRSIHKNKDNSSKGKYGNHDTAKKQEHGKKLQSDKPSTFSRNDTMSEDLSSNSSRSSTSSIEGKRRPRATKKPPQSKERYNAQNSSSDSSQSQESYQDDQSSSDDNEASIGQEEPVQLQSLGVITPLFETNIRYEELSQDEDTDDGSGIHVEFVSDDTHQPYGHETHHKHGHHFKDYHPPTEQPSFEIEFQISDQENPVQKDKSPKKTKNAMGKVLKRVRSQFSFSNLKRMGKEAQNSFSKTLHDRNDPNAYPRKPDRKMLKGDKVKDEIVPTPVSNFVEHFSWDSKRLADPRADLIVTRQVFDDSTRDAGVFLPDWLCPAPLIENASENSLRSSQLVSILQNEYENAKKNQVVCWEKALESGQNNASKNFERVFMHISSKLEFSSEILTLKYCIVQGSPLLGIGFHAGVLKLVQFKDIKKSSSHHRHKEIKDIGTIVVRNELLIGHTTSVTKLGWLYSEDGIAKLMSVDSQGVIVVWEISETPGHQKVALVQDKSFSNVLDFSWSPDSKRVCIIYSDAQNVSSSSIYGLVVGRAEDGKREWTKSLPSNKGPPQAVAWWDETKFILVQGNFLFVYCFTGNLLETKHFDEDELDDHALEDFVSLKLATVLDTSCFGIGLIWQNKIVLLKTVLDNHPLIIHPQLSISSCDWSSNGKLIAISGTKLRRELGSQINIYSSSGNFLTVLKIDEPSISSISWDAEGMNLAIGSQNLLYVASVRIFYKVASTGSIHAYAFTTGSDNFIGIWDKTQTNIQKVDGKVVDLKCHGNRFVLLSMNSEGIYSVAVLNKAGLCIDALVILRMDPFAVCLTDICLICLSSNSILFWRYNSSLSQPDFEGTANDNDKMSKLSCVRQIHIDDASSFTPTVSDTSRVTTDPAICMDAKYDCLVVARSSGKLQIYCLPQGGLLQTTEVSCFSPLQILLNPTGVKIALLDINGSLRLGYLENHGTQVKVDVDIISSGVLNILWSSDIPDFLCVMKRTEMCIIRYANFEKFTNYNALSGHLVGFDNMTITLLNLDEILSNPHQPKVSQIVEVTMQILTCLPEILQSGDAQTKSTCLQKVSHIDHPRLWNVLGEEQLKLGNLEEALFAFVRSRNYPALQFMKKLDILPSHLVQAEVQAFLGDYEVASNSYVEAKRSDLALQMWGDLGDFSRKDRLMARISGSGDAGLQGTSGHSLEKGEKYFRDGEFTKALRIFKTLKQFDRAFECYLALDDIVGLEGLVQRLQKGDPIMEKIAEKYAFMGMTAKAVDIYLQSGSPKKAVEVALACREWSTALEIAAEHGIPMVAQSIVDLTKQLLSSGDIMEAVQFLKKCGKTFTAGKLLATKALRELVSPSANLITIKKLLVMAATLLQSRTELKRTKARTKSRHFLLEDDINVKFDEIIPLSYQPSMEEFRWMRNSPWRGALGVQFCIMTLTRIHIKHFEKAIVLATHLRNYTDILGSERINCLVALASAHGENLFHCLGALSQLEGISEDYAEITGELLASRENKGGGKDAQAKTTRMCCGALVETLREGSEPCPKCDVCLPLCIISGNVLHKRIWTCDNCGASASRAKVKRFRHCPLCHVEVTQVY